MKLVGVYLLILAYYSAKLEYQRFTLKPQKGMRKMIFLLYEANCMPYGDIGI